MRLADDVKVISITRALKEDEEEVTETTVETAEPIETVEAEE